MTEFNARNERVKHAYFEYIKHARGRAEPSIDAAAAALTGFESYTRFKDFRTFHRDQAVGFKRHLTSQSNPRTRKPLSKATLYSRLQALRSFFIWLADQPGYKSKLNYSDADYFNMTEAEKRVVMARREQPVPTLEQIHHVIGAMPSGTDAELRNRALLAFGALTGARVSALSSARLKHVDIEQRLFRQDAREVHTKFSKTFDTWFFPIGGAAFEIMAEWVRHLRGDLLWGEDDPLFPSTMRVIGRDSMFATGGLERTFWKTQQPIRDIYRVAFAAVGLQYFNPHSFRKTLTRLGERLCQSPESFKAWSQNLGHDDVMTSLTSYGTVSPTRQAQIIRELGGETSALRGDDIAARVAALEQTVAKAGR